ncbi:hypothetical protein LQU92_11845 [Kocuria sp. LUK]|uniref:hypothetical protein n=1 Tax=Kocuria sp. LUK TaxID=2897828 RepID=UPI001E4E16BD|nr:hypothetical protein [Kocuria sp. LUK]MCD1145915.1 hypothetical protein [Kocuria sp. LUK]
MAQKGSGSRSGGGSGRGPDGGAPRVSAEVYRRRRIVAAAAAVLLVVLVAVGVVSAVAALVGPEEPAEQAAPEAVASAGPTSTEPFADFTPRPEKSSSASPGASESPSAAPAEECGAELAVRASTDRESYPQDLEPQLELTLENTGEDPCHVDAGTARMAFVVRSGEDTVFDSRHCQVGGEEQRVTLEPGREQVARLTWDRVRTLEGCAAGGEPALPGHYRLEVSLGERTGEPAAFVLEE